MKEFHIQTSAEERSEILCGKGALTVNKNARVVFTDENVLGLYQDTISKYFPNAAVHAMPAGEENKTEQTLFSLLSFMAEAGMHRKDTLVCLGGGVVGDIGGLASALYMRGVDCVQIPTTLLSQVDSSVGGKTAIDFHGVKNLVGVFKQPSSVLVDPLFLNTLPAREIRCGLGEIVKHAALNGELFDALTENRGKLFDLEFLAQIVPQNIEIKADVVARDAREAGLRKCLNLGHTTGHAYELLDGKLSHGEYVLVGTLFETEIAKRKCKCDVEYLNSLQSLCMAVLGTFPALPEAREAANFAKLDKKNSSEKIVVTAPVSRGQYALLELSFEEYAKMLEEIKEKLC